MKLIDVMILVVVVGILGAVLWYIRRAKKRGAKCIGCPDSGNCTGHCSGCCSCGDNKQ